MQLSQFPHPDSSPFTKRWRGEGKHSAEIFEFVCENLPLPMYYVMFNDHGRGVLWLHSEELLFFYFYLAVDALGTLSFFCSMLAASC